MKKWQQFITGTCAVLLVGAGSSAMAADEPRRGDKGARAEARAEMHKEMRQGGWREGRAAAQHRTKGLEALAEALNLTEQQRAQLSAQHAQWQTDNRVERSELHAAHRALREAQANNASDLEVAALRDTLEQLRTQAREQHQQQREQMLAILTPEQQAQLASLRAEREQARAEHREGKRFHRGDKREQGRVDRTERRTQG